MAHVHCMLDNEGYRHTLRICNTYYYSTATMVTRMHLNVILYINCLSCDRLCGLVVRVSGYRYRGPGFDPRRYQIF